MAPRPTSMQIFMNIEQGPIEFDQDYIEQVDKLILEGEPMEAEVKVMGAVKVLRLNTKLWKLIYKEYPSSYAAFMWKADNHINKAKILAQRLGVQATTSEVKKLEKKPSSSHRRDGGQNKLANNFKPFNNEIKVKLLEVLSTTPHEVFDHIKDRKLLNQPKRS